MKERRRFIRFEVTLKVSYVVQGKAPMIEKNGLTKDLTAEGVRLITNESLSEGDSLGLKIELPGALNPVHASGQVIWSEETKTESGTVYNSGIRFIKIEEDNKNTFLEYMCGLMYEKKEEEK